LNKEFIEMKLISFLSSAILFFFPVQWRNNLEEAKQIAQKEHKHILLNFSGSDWCGPCIRMHNEIFEAEVFKNMADTQLVLVNADFPRKKKNQLPSQQQEINNAMADKYNSQGKFPYTVLLDANGKILKEWDGLPNETPNAFTIEVRNGIYADR
jgi:thioredoxin-related protein